MSEHVYRGGIPTKGGQIRGHAHEKEIRTEETYTWRRQSNKATYTSRKYK